MIWQILCWFLFMCCWLHSALFGPLPSKIYNLLYAVQAFWFLNNWGKEKYLDFNKKKLFPETSCMFTFIYLMLLTCSRFLFSTFPTFKQYVFLDRVTWSGLYKINEINCDLFCDIKSWSLNLFIHLSYSLHRTWMEPYLNVVNVIKILTWPLFTLSQHKPPPCH